MVEHTETLQMIAIDKLIPYANNARTHSDEQIKQIQASIREFGFVNPVLIDGKFNIIAGHGRILAAKLEGIEEVPCVLVEYLTEAQKKAYMLADNKLALNAGWDMEMLKIELEELKDLDFDLALTGFDDLEINLMFDENKEVEEDGFDVDKALEDIKEPTTKLGDIWQLGKHRLMCGDSTTDDVDVLMNGEKADMVFTDPPYGMFLNADYTSLSWGDRKGKKYDNVIGDHEDFNEDLIIKIFDNFGYCKEIFLWGADYYYKLIPNFDDGHYMVWDKTLESNGDAGSNSEFEMIWTKTKHKRQVIHFNWFRFFGLSQQDIKTREHPTQKPLQVCTPFIDKYSKMDNIIIDVFGGSGSTLIACEQTNRICYMMELDEKYCDVIIKRYEILTGEKAVLLDK